MKTLRKVIALSLMVVLLFSGTIKASAVEYGSYFDTMLQFMRGMYYKDVTDEDGLKAALKGMFSALDPYSSFYDREETEALNSSLNGNFVGIGAGLEKGDKGIRITKVYEGSPAEAVGVQEGDIITAVDGSSVVDKDAETVAAAIRGEEGTWVRLTILRGDKTKEFSIKRGLVTINPILYRLEGDVAYIRIDSFSLGTSNRFNEALEEANKNKIHRIILDLRGNGGGYVDEAVKVAEQLIPPGVVTTLDYKSEEMLDRVYYAKKSHPDYIVAVLVDKGTASASEILAGALEDAGNGFLLGQNTYGKGVFQNLFTILTPEAYLKYSELYGDQYVTELQWMSYYGVFPDNDEILGTVKLTTGHYLTPKGRAINGIGLAPVITLPDPSAPNGVDLSSVSILSNTVPMAIDQYDIGVYHAEKVLKAAGYLSTTADRYFDSATQEAIKQYQKAYKLPQTGIIDIKTRDQLNKTLIELRNNNDKQYAKAVELLNWFGVN